MPPVSAGRSSTIRSASAPSSSVPVHTTTTFTPLESQTRHQHTPHDNNSSRPQQQQQQHDNSSSQRGKHIEVCIRLRPLVVEGTTSSSSFFHPSTTHAAQQQQQQQQQRKPAIPRPLSSLLATSGGGTANHNSNSNNHRNGTPHLVASTISGSSISPKSRLSPQSQSQSPESVTAETTTTTPAKPTTYAWDVVDMDTVAQNATTDIVPGRTHTYTLDRVYGPLVNTRTVYQQSVRDLVHAAMDGYHTAVLAYGQTATGKTHTMTGTFDEPGFIPLSVRECFQCLQTVGRTGEYLLRVSYLEVYKEHIKDLLNSSNVQAIRLFETNGTLQIRGLKEVVVTSPEQVFAILAAGEARRQVGATHLNQHSSRSHVMVRIWIESRTVGVGNRESLRVSSLSLVDLAGSESVRLTGSTERQSEGHYINKSLMTLGQVVYALSEAETKDGVSANKLNKHVPYRDSKLTRLLQPSLSGNAQVVLLCCISPLSSHIEESHNTFKFAVRAKRIPQKAVRQEQSAADETTLLQTYRAEIEDLKQQLRDAQEAQRLQLLPLNTTTTTTTTNNNDFEEDTEEKEMQELVEAIQTMEQLILKTRPVPTEEGLLNFTSEDDTNSPAHLDDDQLLTSAGTERVPATPERSSVHGTTGSLPSQNSNDVLQVELSRIQGLLGSVLKKRRCMASSSSGTAPVSNISMTRMATSEEEVRNLRAALEQQEVVTSLRQADSSFLQAQLEEKDNLLAEVAKLLEAVEERQAALEAENIRLRKEVSEMRAAPYRK